MLRGEVEKALRALTFHIRYECGLGWKKEKMATPLKNVADKDPGEKERRIDKLAKRGQRNKRMSKDEHSIVWAADDPEEHSFEFEYKNERGELEAPLRTTVCEYYRRRYDIKLQYPKMPMVRISKEEYFPVEFLFQAQGPAPKCRDDNDAKTEITKYALSFNDKYACRDRVQEIARVLHRQDFYEPLAKKLQLLNLKMESSPLVLRAKVLRTPRIVDGAKSGFEVKNGSWNLQGKKFFTPSTMHSFAVVNLAGESRSDLPTKLFEALQEHGVHLPFLGDRSDLSRARRLWEELRVDVYVAPRRTVDSRRLRGAFQEARDKARNTFLTQRLAHSLCFPTIAHVDLRGDGELSALEVVVFPRKLVTDEEGVSIPEGCYGAMDIKYLEQNNPSHTVTLRDGERIDAWLRYQIDNGDIVEPMTAIDAFLSNPRGEFNPIFYGSDNNPIRRENGDFVELQRIRRVVKENGEQADTPVGYLVSEDDIECPSLVYVLVPGKDSEPYHIGKWSTFLDLKTNCKCRVATAMFLGMQCFWVYSASD